jgi:hypothetical protein
MVPVYQNDFYNIVYQNGGYSVNSEFYSRTVIIDGRANEEVIDFFINRNIEVIKVENILGARPETACHPDIFFHAVSGRKLVCAPQVAEMRSECDILRSRGFDIIFGKTKIRADYSFEAAYNVARVGRFAFHNLKYTDSVLRAELEKESVSFIHVNQGYTKCSVSIVNEDSIITADSGIAKAAAKAGIDALLIEPDQGIYLNGKHQGFIGGATGKLDNTWLLAGELSHLKDCKKIEKFINSKNVDVACISRGQAVDIGTIMVI